MAAVPYTAASTVRPAGARTALRVRPLRDAALLGGILLATAISSIVLIYIRAVAVQRAEVQAGLLRTAEAAAALVDGDRLRTFTDPEQEQSPEYRAAVEPLRQMLTAMRGVRFLYTVALVKDEVRFVLDATPPGDADGDGVEDHSGLMERYDEPDPEMLLALREGREATDSQPYTDRWGMLWSAYAPIRDSRGQAVGSVGVDITANEYQQRIAGIRRAAYWSLLPALVLSIMLGAGVYRTRRTAWGLMQERERAEQRLSLTQFALDHAGEAAFWFDPQSRLVYVNDAACQTLGYAREELQTLTVADLDPDFPAERWPAHWQELKAHGTLRFESRHRRKDGRIYPVAITANYFTFGDQEYNFAFVREITESKRLEQELRAAGEYNRTLIEANPDPLVILDIAGRLTDVNAAAADLLGWSRAELVGREVADFTENPQQTRVAHTEILRVGQVRDRELNLRPHDGPTIPISYSASVYRDSSGQSAGVCVSARDVTERNAIRRRLEEACTRAEEASRAKSAFVANMSHEIRTPMTAILGFVDLLADGCPQECEFGCGQAAEHIETVRRNAHYLLDLINDILDLSKIEAGKMRVETIPCFTLNLVAEIASLMRVRARAKGLDFRVECIGSLPQQFRTDPTRLRQVLINLIGNAIKFTETGSVRLVVRYAASAAGNATVPGPVLQFDVIDTGIGLTPEQRERLFQPFMQADSSTSRRFGGTGLGLTICRRLVELLGGTVAIESTSAAGSTFRVSVPTGPLESVAFIVAESTSEPHVLESARGEAVGQRLSGRILLAEDGSDNQRLIAFLLQKQGAEVDVAANGRIALDMALTAAAGHRPYALILMDMQMPEMDGYEATKTLRRRGYRGAIVALTAHAMAGDREKCLAAGCDGYATKPIERATLFATISPYLQGHAPATCATRSGG